MVDKETNEKVAYVHMKNTGCGEFKILIEMTSEAITVNALILDLRYNTGEMFHDEFSVFIATKICAMEISRGKWTGQSNFNPADKPYILLINENFKWCRSYRLLGLKS